MKTETPSISVVIPTLNEAASIAEALERLSGLGLERIVVDGGSSDGTCELAGMAGAEKILRSAPGRALQMERGAREACGEIVLFLHADTELEQSWLPELRSAMQDPSLAGGAFRLRFDSERPLYRFIEWGARMRVRLGGLPYGDQGLFVRRKSLEAAGGIPEVPLFEDLDLARLVRAAGGLVVLAPRALTSPRRYEANGILRTWLRNSVALVAYGLGLNRDFVARWYRRKRDR